MNKKLVTLLVPVVFAVSGFTALASETEGITGELPPFTNPQRMESAPVSRSTRSDISYTPKEQETILALQKEYETLGNNQLPQVKYLEQPLVGSSGYRLGSLNTPTVDNSLKNLNYYRHIAGIHTVRAEKEENKYSQYASIGMAATRDQSHGLVHSVKPLNMPTNMWTYSVKYTKESVLHSSSKERSLNDHTLAYLADYGLGNRNVGHRSWLLSHEMNYVGFGYAAAENPTSEETQNYYTGMYIFDNDHTTTPKDKIVTWPSQGVFPLNLMQNSDRPDEPLRWSVHLNSAGYQVSDQTSVKLTNTQTNDVWSFSKTNTSDGDFNYSNKGAGGYNTLMFQPRTDGTKPFRYNVGDLFSVEVKGLTGVATSYTYQVRLFDVTQKATTIPVQSIALSTTKPEWRVGETGTLQATISPANATDQSLVWSSSDQKIATVDQTGKVTALSTGTVTISVRSVSSNVTRTLSLTIKNASTIPVTQVGYLLSNYQNIPVGGTVKINGYVAAPYNASNQTILYKVRPEDVGKISVSETGLVQGNVTGMYTIDLVSADGGAKNQVGIKVGEGNYWVNDFPFYLGGTPITPIPVSSVQLTQSDLTGTVGTKWTLTSEVFPKEATNPYRRYRSSNPAIVVIPNPDKGEVTALQKGSATITVFTADGMYEDTLQITVQ